MGTCWEGEEGERVEKLGEFIFLQTYTSHSSPQDLEKFPSFKSGISKESLMTLQRMKIHRPEEEAASKVGHETHLTTKKPPVTSNPKLPVEENTSISMSSPAAKAKHPTAGHAFVSGNSIPDLPLNDPCAPLCDFRGGWKTANCQECIFRGLCLLILLYPSRSLS